MFQKAYVSRGLSDMPMRGYASVETHVINETLPCHIPI